MEKWVPAVGFEGYYEVSDKGNVRSVRYDHVGNVIYSNLLRPAVTHHGYYNVGLSVQSKRFNYLVHRLVAKAFIPNPNNLPEVNHLDGNKLNNDVSNLSWCSSSENIAHAYAIGLKTKAGRAVRCVETGEVFPMMKSVGNYHVRDACNDPRRTANGFHWEWV